MVIHPIEFVENFESEYQDNYHNKSTPFSTPGFAGIFSRHIRCRDIVIWFFLQDIGCLLRSLT